MIKEREKSQRYLYGSLMEPKTKLLRKYGNKLWSFAQYFMLFTFIITWIAVTFLPLYFNRFLIYFKLLWFLFFSYSSLFALYTAFGYKFTPDYKGLKELEYEEKKSKGAMKFISKLNVASYKSTISYSSRWIIVITGLSCLLITVVILISMIR